MKTITISLLMMFGLTSLLIDKTEPYILSNSEISLISLVVLAEAGVTANQFERDLILECIIYKKYLWDKDNLKTFDQYFKAKPLHFDGYNIRKRYVGHPQLANVTRDILFRLDSDKEFYRPIRYFHIVKTSTNKSHIIDVLMKCINGDLTYVNKSTNLKLLHDIFEDNSPPEGYVDYRSKFKI